MDFFEINFNWIQYLITHPNKYKALKKVKKFLDQYNVDFPIISSPLLINQKCYNNLCYASNSLIKSQTKILKVLVKENSKKTILKIFGLPGKIEHFVDWNKLLSNRIIGRFDIIISTNNRFKFCEINVDSAINGLKFYDAFEKYFRELNLPFQKGTSSPRSEITKYLKSQIKKGGFTRIIIFSLNFYIVEGSGTIYALFDLIKKTLPEIEVLLVDEKTYPEELLTKEEGRKTLVYRMAIYRDIKNDELLEKIFASGARMISMFENEIRSNKKWFSIFYDLKYQKYLSTNEIEIINKYIPKTYSLSNNNLDYYLENKDKYVFKKNMSYGGLGVFFGSEFSQSDLKKKIVNCEDDWIVQEAVKTKKIILPEDQNYNMRNNSIVLGLFSIFGKHTGMLVRASSNSDVVNVTYGGAKMGWAYPVISTKKW